MPNGQRPSFGATNAPQTGVFCIRRASLVSVANPQELEVPVPEKEPAFAVPARGGDCPNLLQAQVTECMRLWGVFGAADEHMTSFARILLSVSSNVPVCRAEGSA